jgi:NitT/TauT family transport system substrate-binding protein
MKRRLKSSAFKLLGIICVAALLVLPSGCQGGKVTEVTIGTIQWPGYALLRYAQERGLFEKEGARVNVIHYDNVELLHKDYYAGKLDGMTGTLSEILATREKSTRSPQVFLVADFSNGPDMIVGNTGVVDSVPQLRGKRVGVDIQSLGVYVLTRGLERSSLSLDDVRLVDMTMDKMEAALAKGGEDGGVDAIVAYPPVTTSILKNLKAKPIFTSKEIPGEVVDIVALETDLIQKNREFVEGIVRGFSNAVEQLRKHPQDAITQMAKAEGMSTEEFSDILSGLKILDVCEQRDYFLPSGILIEAVKTSDLVMRRVDQLLGADTTVGMVTFGPVQVAGKFCDA